MKTKSLSWFQFQAKGMGLTLSEIAETLGLSRPSLYKYISHPEMFTMKHLNTLRTIGFVIPGDTAQAPIPKFMPFSCPTCDGTGWIYKAIKETKSL